jgi:hypothetical protein
MFLKTRRHRAAFIGERYERQTWHTIIGTNWTSRRRRSWYRLPALRQHQHLLQPELQDLALPEVRALFTVEGLKGGKSWWKRFSEVAILYQFFMVEDKNILYISLQSPRFYKPAAAKGCISLAPER